MSIGAGVRPRGKYRDGISPPLETELATFGLVYFLHAPEVGRVKIGHTDRDNGQRILGLRSDNAAVVRPIAYLRGTVEVEYAIHDLFASRCHHGEWFAFDAEIEEFAVTLATAWPERRHPDSTELLPSVARLVVARTIRALGWWARRALVPNPPSRMDWSAGLPNPKKWEASVVAALDAREPPTDEQIRRDAYLEAQREQWKRMTEAYDRRQAARSAYFARLEVARKAANP